MSLNKGLIFPIIAALGLGAVTTQAKLVYADGGNAVTMMVWRFVLTALVIGGWILIKRKSFKVANEYKLPTILLGLIWLGSMICYLTSVETISVSAAVLILYSYPILVLIVSIMCGWITLSVSVVLGFILAFVGIAMVLGGGDIVLHPIGITMAILAAVGAAYTFISGSMIAPKLDPIVLAFWVNFMGILLIIPFVYGQFQMPETQRGLMFLGGASACYIVAIICQFQALAIMPAAKAAFILNLEPLVSIFLALVILDERLVFIQWIGVTMVLVVLLCYRGTMDKTSESSG